jgi:hypothetical protein
MAMSNVIAIMPATDFASRAAAQWGTEALNMAHNLLPAAGNGASAGFGLSRIHIEAAIKESQRANGLALCYFGHGQDTSWVIYSDNKGGPPLTFQHSIVGVPDASLFTGLVVASVACFTGRKFGPEIASKGGVFVGFENQIAWRPDIEETATAVRGCLRDLVRLVIRKGRAVTRQELDQLVDEHISYWQDNDRGDAGSINARIAASFLSSIRDGMVLIQ